MKLRIVGGDLSGRRFAGPKGDGTRPTSERVREALGSALSARGCLVGAHVLDLFAGTGALAFEALSRGAASAVLVEGDKRAARAIGESARALGLGARTRVLCLDLAGRPATVARRIEGARPYDLVLADPPYADVDLVAPLIEALADAGALAADAVVALEHARRHPPSALGRLASLAEYRYGDTAVRLLSGPAPGEPE